MLKILLTNRAKAKIAIFFVAFFLINQFLGGFAWANSAAPTPALSIAFYYNNTDSVRELLSYDRVVVSPDALDKDQLKQLQQAKVEVFAYLSIGEATRAIAETLADAKLAENKA